MYVRYIKSLNKANKQHRKRSYKQVTSRKCYLLLLLKNGGLVMEKVLYMVIQKDGEKAIKWAIADSIEKFIPMCKYLLKNIKSSKDFIVVWSDGIKTKERNFAEFCDIQGITEEGLQNGRN